MTAGGVLFALSLMGTDSSERAGGHIGLLRRRESLFEGLFTFDTVPRRAKPGVVVFDCDHRHATEWLAYDCASRALFVVVSGIRLSDLEPAAAAPTEAPR